MAANSPRLSVDCSSCRPTDVTRESLKKAKKKERRVSEIGVFYEAGGDGEGRKCPPVSPESPSYRCFKQMKEELEREEKKLTAKKKKEKEKEKETRKGKKLLSNGYGFTTSSSEDSDNDDVGDFFSSDENGGLFPREGTLLKERERETEALFSSRSISSDSSEIYYQTSLRYTRKKKPSRRRQHKSRKGDGGRSRHNSLDDGLRPLLSISSCSSSLRAGATRADEETAAVLVEEEEVDVGMEGFAVEKQSSDPYADFRSSMLEMIVEKQLFGARELEHLLHCYLVLNSPCQHPIIFEVFSEICETLFSN